MNIPFTLPGSDIAQTGDIVVPPRLRMPQVVLAWAEPERVRLAYTPTGAFSGGILSKYTRVSDYLMDHPVLSNSEKMCLFHLMRHAQDYDLDSGEEVQVEIGPDQLQESLGVSKATFHETVANLERFCLIRVEQKKTRKKDEARTEYWLVPGPWPMLGDIPELLAEHESMGQTMHTWRSNNAPKYLTDNWREMVLKGRVNPQNVFGTLAMLLEGHRSFYITSIEAELPQFVDHFEQALTNSKIELTARSRVQFLNSYPAPVSAITSSISELTIRIDKIGNLPTHTDPAGDNLTSQKAPEEAKTAISDHIDTYIYRSSKVNRNRFIKSASAVHAAKLPGVQMSTDKIGAVLAAQTGRKPKNKLSPAEEVIQAYVAAAKEIDPEFSYVYNSRKTNGMINVALRKVSLTDALRSLRHVLRNWPAYRPESFSTDSPIPGLETLMSSYFLTKGINDSRNNFVPKVSAQKWNAITNDQMHKDAEAVNPEAQAEAARKLAEFKSKRKAN